MVLNKIKKIVFGTTLACMVGVSVFASACTVETAHPSAKITFEFNNETYEVDYTLYRNMYPQTVKHFIELADNGFYDNMIIHNYSANDWFTGGYTYNAEAYTSLSENGDTMGEYFTQSHSKEAQYATLFNDGKLTPSVYSNIDYKTDSNGQTIVDENGRSEQVINSQYALPTLMGEFSSNINQEIKQGALSAEMGCLKMFYYAKETTQKVYVTPSSKQIIQADYKGNCATSLFSIQVGASTSYSATKYTVFAKVANTEALENFVDAVKDYFSNLTSATVSATVYVDGNEQLSKEESDKNTEVTFAAPKTPIIVKSVKITKY